MDESNIIRGINAAIKKREGRFCCGGMLMLGESIRIWYTKDDETEGVFRLPVEHFDETGIEELLSQTKSLQNDTLVHELGPSSFATNFDLGRFFILDEITKLLDPGASLRAQLDRLTVVSTGGEREVDKSILPDEDPDVFGYLVIALPFAFTGGDIMVRKNGSKLNTFSTWGNDIGFQWVAFIAGCDHLITEVTSGYLITLTYKLFRLNKRKRVLGVNDTLIDAHSLPLYELWIDAKKNSEFYPEGAVLAFACQQHYDLDQELKNLDGVKDDKAWVLKGADAMLFAAVKAAGLAVSLRPVYRNSSDENPALLYVGKVVGEKAPLFLGEMREGFDDLDRDTTGADELPKIRDGVQTDADIKWCLKNFSWITGKECGTYRSEQVDVSWFYSSALVVIVPPLAERQKEDDTGDRAEVKRVKTYNEACAAWFREAEEKATREVPDYEYKTNSDEEENDYSEDEEDLEDLDKDEVAQEEKEGSEEDKQETEEDEESKDDDDFPDPVKNPRDGENTVSDDAPENGGNTGSDESDYIEKYYIAHDI